jgi:hypothetical protein
VLDEMWVGQRPTEAEMSTATPAANSAAILVVEMWEFFPGT